MRCQLNLTSAEHGASFSNQKATCTFDGLEMPTVAREAAPQPSENLNRELSAVLDSYSPAHPEYYPRPCSRTRATSSIFTNPPQCCGLSNAYQTLLSLYNHAADG